MVRERSRSDRRSFGSVDQVSGGLVGGSSPKRGAHTGFPPRSDRAEWSGRRRADSGGTRSATGAEQRSKDQPASRRRERLEESPRHAGSKEYEKLSKTTDRRSSTKEVVVQEVPTDIGGPQKRRPSFEKGSSPPGSSVEVDKLEVKEIEVSRAESPVSGSWDTASQQGSDFSGGESPSEVGGEGAGEEYLKAFCDYCSGLDLGGKSMSQMAVLLVQVVHRSCGNVGAYAERAARSGSSQQGTGETWRDLLPLPVPKRVADLVIEIWKNEGYVVKKSGKTGAQVQHEYRDVGIDCLQFCMIVGLNLMWSGLRGGARIHGGPVKAGQTEALSHLRRAAGYVIDGREAPPLKGVPRTPKDSWKRLVDEARISYHGEVIQKAEALEFDRVLPSLPPEGFGGIADLASLCEGHVKEMVLNPQLCQLEEADLPDVIPAPKVRVKQGDWDKLARALFERGILAPVDQVIGLRGRSVLNGLFGVQKAGRDLPDGRPAQRLIMDLRATNAILKIIAGDISTLAGASAFTSVVIEEGKVVTISGDDLVYLFKMPPAWLPYLAFERSVSWKALGFQKEGYTHLAAAVLPMGFSSSVGLMQHIHRRLALWDSPSGASLRKELEVRKDREWPVLDEESPAWVLYLDDSTFLNVLEAELAKQVVGKPPKEQERLRRAYQFWGVPYNMKKATEQVLTTERLGAFLDGEVGRLGVTTKRLLENLSLGLWVLGQRRVSRKSLQVFAGKEVHILQFRRPLFSVYDRIWKLIAGESDWPWLTEDVIDEIVTGLSLLPLRFTDWRADLDPHVMASDASEFGGGFVIAKRLTKSGLEALRQFEAGEKEVRTGIVVFDFFAGIGGLVRSLERAGVNWEHHVVIESDRQCRRCIRQTWPGASEYPDVTKMTKDDIRREIGKVENPTVVVAGGGSPCQGLSRLSSERQHFKDGRSALFFCFADRLDDIQEVCKELNIRFVGLVENVVMDESDRNDISYRLGWVPHLVEAGDTSWVRRSRFYWLNRELPPTAWFDVLKEDVVARVRIAGEPEPEELWIPDGWSWESHDQKSRLPTFTRPIKRRAPPPSPAGLKGCSREAQDRWTRDNFRFPPYTYKDENMLRDQEGNFQKVPAESRELLMGFRRGHTLKLDRELCEKLHYVDSEDLRQGALGNSFHTTVVALVLGALLYKIKAVDSLCSPSSLVDKLVAEDEAGRPQDCNSEGTVISYQGVGESSKGLEDDELLGLLEEPQLEVDEVSLHKSLMSKLVHLFLRRVELRGSDIRLDTGTLFRPDCCPRASVDPLKWEWRHCRAFKWRRSEHINVLEMKAALHAIQWRGRRSAYRNFRTMILIDNQSVLAVMAKGRSSSRKINLLLRRLAALCCALNVYLLVCWVDTTDNPADEASRWYDPRN